ncbi:MAG: oxygenase MpaB family protein [Rhodomicrobiaceae bacterium]
MLAASTIPFSGWLRSALAAEAQRFLFADGERVVDFRTPENEPALCEPHSVSWQVFKNPVTLFIGGVAAVVLELAEPRVRTGVWEHTSFRADPVRRLRRTGLAAMMTVYGPRSRAEAMIAGVRRMHAQVKGTTPIGNPYSADDPELLDWVQATASFGFVDAYRHFARPLSPDDSARYYTEGAAAASLYGARGAPRSAAEMEALFVRMAPKLEPSPIIFEFLTIMRRAAVLPRATRALQDTLVRAGVDMVPRWARDRLQLGHRWGLNHWERRLVRAAAAVVDRMPLDGSPPVEACLRLGLPPDFLYRRQG